jgi:hypothetical protein
MNSESLRSDDEVRRARAQLWKLGCLDYKLHAGQLRIDEIYRQEKAKLFALCCARRLGKTYWDTDVSLETAIKIPKARVKYVSAFLTDLEEYAIPSFQKALADCPRPLIPQEIVTKKKWRFSNGSEIKLVGLDKNPNGMRGNYADLVVFAEAGLIKRLAYLYSDVTLPMTMYRPWARVIMDGTPPETPDHDFKDFCERAEALESYVHMTIYENPLLTPAEIEEIHRECLNETTWRREYLAEFVVDQERAIIPEWRDELCQDVPRDPLFNFFRRYASMDLGVVDQTVAHWGYYEFPKARFVFEDEAMMQGPDMTTDRLGELLKGKESALWPDGMGGVLPVYRRTSDNNNLLLINDLAKYGLHWQPTDKELLHQMVNKLRIWVREGRVVVSPKCKLLRGCLKNGIWDEQRKKFNQSTTYGHYDALASAIYMIRNVDEHDNPIPANLGINPSDYFIRPGTFTPKVNQELKKLIRRSGR